MTCKRLLAAVGLLSTLGLAGCADAGAADVGFGGSPSKQCVHLESGDRVLIGETIAAKQHPISLKAVQLVNATGVKVLGSWIIPIRGGSALGVADVPPPSYIAWADRREVADFSVPANSQYNVVLEVQKNTATTGRATAIQIQGSTGGSQFTRQATTSYTFPIRCF